jgi:hypothetical protein
MAGSPLLRFRTIAMSKLLIWAKKLPALKITREIKESQYFLFLKIRETRQEQSLQSIGFYRFQYSDLRIRDIWDNENSQQIHLNRSNVAMPTPGYGLKWRIFSCLQVSALAFLLYRGHFTKN